MPNRKAPVRHKPTLSRRRAKIAGRREQEEELDEGLRDSFPASDPVSASQPGPAAPGGNREKP